MRAYRLDYIKTNIMGSIIKSYAEINVDPKIIVKRFKQEIFDAHKILEDPEGIKLKYTGICRITDFKELVTILEVAHINDDVCTISYNLNKEYIKCFIRPIYVEELSDTFNFVNVQQDTRQEMYNWIKGYLKMHNNTECALDALATCYDLKKE